MELCENIYSFRRDLKMSQEELAEKCGISRQAVTKWEISESVPSLEKLILLADIFGISLDELVGRRVMNSREKFFQLLEEYIVDDYPKEPEYDCEAILRRYILYMEKINVDPVDILEGFKAIFVREEIK